MQTAEDRAKIKASHPRAHLEDRHTQGCMVLPHRERLLDVLPKNAVVAEIGAAFGDFTREILPRARPQKLHLIDAWEMDRYKQGLLDIEQSLTEDIESGRVEINQGYSTVVLDTFDDDYFDWVYIDTNHSYKTTALELQLAEKKCKGSGRICGHDFTSGNIVTPVPYGVIEACNEFCVKKDWRYEYITLEYHGHFSFCLRRID